MYWVISLLIFFSACAMQCVVPDLEEDPGQLTDYSVMPSVNAIENKHKLFHNFLHKHAKEGTRYRKYLNRALAESSSDSSSSRPRTISQTDFDEFLFLLGKASDQLEHRSCKKEKENRNLRILSLLTSCYGITCTACVPIMTGIFTVIIAYFSTGN